MSVIRPTADEWAMLERLGKHGAVDMTLIVGNIDMVELHEFWKFQRIDRSGPETRMVTHTARSLTDLYAKVFPSAGG